MAELAHDDDIPDWLKAVQSEDEGQTPQEPAQESSLDPAQDAPVMSEESLADWQIDDEGAEDTPVDQDKIDTDELGTSATEQDDAIAWLESLASKHGAKPEELVTDPDARTETEPDWIQKAKATAEQADAEESTMQEQTPAETPADLPEFLAQEESAPVEELAPDAGESVTEEQPAVESSTDLPDFLAGKTAETTEEPAAEADASDIADLGTSAQEQDDAVAWLESLASKHGAKPEELVTDPESRKETAPEWVQKASEAGAENAVGERPTAPPSEELEELAESVLGEQEEPSEVVEEEGQREESIPSAETDETGIWLQELDEEESFIEDDEPTVEAETPTMEEDDIPDWLRDMEGDAPQTEAAPASVEDSSLPDWLKGMDAGPSEADSPPDPSPGEEVSESEPEPVNKIDINTASIDELAELPGIGDLLAQNIVAHRETYGGFSGLDDLSNIAGIGPSTIDELRGQVDIEKQPDITDWLRDMEVESSEEGAEEPPVESTDESAADDLPSWLADIDKEREQPQPDAEQNDDVPEWLRAEIEEQSEQPQPTAPTDWQPADVSPSNEEPPDPEPEVDEPKAEEQEPVPMPEPEDEGEKPAPAAELEGKTEESAATPEPDIEEAEPEPADAPEMKAEVEEPGAETIEEEAAVQTAHLSDSEPELQPESETPAEEGSAYQEPITRSRTGMTGILSDVEDPAFAEAQSELTRGDITSAMESYNKLIKKGKMLDEIIFDLREALYRYPVDVTIFQTLGDAYMRADRLQEALDTYTKAEELLR